MPETTNQTSNRVQRTAVQTGGSTGAVLLINYILKRAGVEEIDPEVLLIALGFLITAWVAVQNFAEDQGWIKDRRVYVE